MSAAEHSYIKFETEVCSSDSFLNYSNDDALGPQHHDPINADMAAINDFLKTITRATTPLAHSSPRPRSDTRMATIDYDKN